MNQKYVEKNTVSPISAPVAAILSLLLPGLGQIIARKIQRGMLLFGAFISIFGLFVWRIKVLGRLADGFWPSLFKALERAPFFAGIGIFAVALLWVWIIIDAAAQTRKKRQYGNTIFALVLLIFFSIGWQISEIDIVKLTSDANEAWVPLSKILWPWDAAVTHKVDTVEAGAEILVDSEGEAPPAPEKEEGEPYVWVDPRAGELSKLDEDNEIIPGTEITVYGENFEPNTETKIWWSDAIGNEFQPRFQGKYVSTVTDEMGSLKMKMNMPYRLVPPSAKGPQVHKVMARQVSEV